MRIALDVMSGGKLLADTGASSSRSGSRSARTGCVQCRESRSLSSPRSPSSSARRSVSRLLRAFQATQCRASGASHPGSLRLLPRASLTVAEWASESVDADRETRAPQRAGRGPEPFGLSTAPRANGAQSSSCTGLRDSIAAASSRATSTVIASRRGMGRAISDGHSRRRVRAPVEGDAATYQLRRNWTSSESVEKPAVSGRRSSRWRSTSRTLGPAAIERERMTHD